MLYICSKLFGMAMLVLQECISKLGAFKQAFGKQFGITKLGIFGSVARNEHQSESDLDIFVELQEPDFFIMSDIQETLEQICNCKVDLLRLRKDLRPLLLKRIEQDGIYA